MELGVFLVVFGDRPFEAALDEAVRLGLQRVEIGTGNYPGDAHCRPAELLSDAAGLTAFRGAVESRGLRISALSCHGNPLHPQRSVAERSHDVFRQTVELARRLDVEVVNVFSGCPGDSDSATYPNWVTFPWPKESGELLEWQWREKVLPYWREQAAFARERRVRLGFEMHPGFVVYNPPTLLRLREACDEAVGANLDPSHLFWQGIDVEAAVAELGRAGAIFHVHAKDTAISAANVAITGVLDTTPLAQIGRRSWAFRTPGYGHSEIEWRRILMALRLAGYDGTVSIEHEDALLSRGEGLAKGIAFLRSVMPAEPPLASAWWA